MQLRIDTLSSRDASRIVIQEHYLHRRPPISYSFGGYRQDGVVVAVITFGVPPSRHLQQSACPSNPSKVIELNRVWIHDDQPKNTGSWILSRVLKLMPPYIIVSYADTLQNHDGTLYRAANWNYAGWTDMDRKTPRYDYVVEGKHSRDAFRQHNFTRVRRAPKIKYWTVTGNKREKRDLCRLCGWPSYNWNLLPPPTAPMPP